MGPFPVLGLPRTPELQSPLDAVSVGTGAS